MSEMFTHAIVRKPGDNFARGITTSNLGTPRYELMMKQHEDYIKTLRSLGLELIVLDALPDYPDAYFVEDTAVVTPKGKRIQSNVRLPRFVRPFESTPPGLLTAGMYLWWVRIFLSESLSARTEKGLHNSVASLRNMDIPGQRFVWKQAYT